MYRYRYTRWLSTVAFTAYETSKCNWKMGYSNYKSLETIQTKLKGTEPRELPVIWVRLNKFIQRLALATSKTGQANVVHFHCEVIVNQFVLRTIPQLCLDLPKSKWHADHARRKMVFEKTQHYE